MIFGAGYLDLLALVLFFVGVVAYGRFADHYGQQFLNARMRDLRGRWMRRYLERDDRVIDSILTGHSINSIALFCSATLLIVVALLGVLTNVDEAYRVSITSTFVSHTTVELFQVKLIGLACVFIYGFYRFTWALLQYNYFLALIGSATFKEHLKHDRIVQVADQLSIVLNSAVTSFHSGFRTYYYALAWVGWFFHPLVFIAAICFVNFVLVYRQIASPSAGAIRRIAVLLHEIEEETRRN
jgi:uncharacterized membrane protein